MLRNAFVLLLAALLTISCASSNPDDQNQKAKRGAGIGAAAGAVVGAVVGNQSGSPRTGAVVGAAAGAAIGAAIGHRMDQQQKELQQIPGVEVTRPAENEIAVRLTNDILFDFNSAALRPESRQTLNDLASNFQRYPDETSHRRRAHGQCRIAGVQPGTFGATRVRRARLSGQPGCAFIADHRDRLRREQAEDIE